MMGDLGFGFDKAARKWGGIVEVLDPALQAAIADVPPPRLNILMSMRSRESRFLRGDARCLSSIVCRNIRRALRKVFEKHGRAAPGMRTPRSAACMCAPSQPGAG